MARWVDNFLSWIPGRLPVHHEPLEGVNVAKKDKDKKPEDTETEPTQPEGDLQDGATVLMGGSSGGSEVRMGAAPTRIDMGATGGISPSPGGSLYQSDNVLTRKTPKGFQPGGRPVDVVQLSEPGDMKTVWGAVNNWIPTDTDSQFVKQVLLKMLGGP